MSNFSEESETEVKPYQPPSDTQFEQLMNSSVLFRDNSEITSMIPHLTDVQVMHSRDALFGQVIIDGVFRQLFAKVLMNYEQLIDQRFY